MPLTNGDDQQSKKTTKATAPKTAAKSEAGKSAGVVKTAKTGSAKKTEAKTSAAVKKTGQAEKAFASKIAKVKDAGSAKEAAPKKAVSAKKAADAVKAGTAAKTLKTAVERTAPAAKAAPPKAAAKANKKVTEAPKAAAAKPLKAAPAEKTAAPKAAAKTPKAAAPQTADKAEKATPSKVVAKEAKAAQPQRASKSEKLDKPKAAAKAKKAAEPQEVGQAKKTANAKKNVKTEARKIDETPIEEGAVSAENAPAVEDVRADRPNFLTSAKFNDFDLPHEVLLGIDEVGFEYCTPIQALSIPVALKGLDIAGQAQTGTGKTTAFLVPMINRLLSNPPIKEGLPRALIVTPTRELALQIHEDALALAKYTGLRQVLVIGGMEYREQAALLETGPEIVICTPGRIIDYLQQGIFKTQAIEVVVVDEADRLLDMGFIKDLKYLLGKLPHYTKRQTMLFSATLDDRVLELTYEFMNPPQYITAEPDKNTKVNIEQELYYIGREEKLSLLIGLLRKEEHNRVIIFSNTKSGVEWLAKKLELNGFAARGITGDLPQPKRLKLMDDFKEDRLKILVATDVASRGIHVDDVSHVYNYDLPQDAENYVHRIGRTARAGKAGKAISFGCEDYVFHLEPIENLLGEKIPVIWPGDNDFADDVAGVVSIKSRFGDKRGGRGERREGGRGGESGGERREGGRGGERGERGERREGGRGGYRGPGRSQRAGGIFGLSSRITTAEGEFDPAQYELTWQPEGYDQVVLIEPLQETQDDEAQSLGGGKERRRRGRSRNKNRGPKNAGADTIQDGGQGQPGPVDAPVVESGSPPQPQPQTAAPQPRAEGDNAAQSGEPGEAKSPKKSRSRHRSRGGRRKNGPRNNAEGGGTGDAGSGDGGPAGAGPGQD